MRCPASFLLPPYSPFLFLQIEVRVRYLGTLRSSTFVIHNQSYDTEWDRDQVCNHPTIHDNPAGAMESKTYLGTHSAVSAPRP